MLRIDWLRPADRHPASSSAAPRRRARTRTPVLGVVPVEGLVHDLPLGVGGQPAHQPLVELRHRHAVQLPVPLQRDRRQPELGERGVRRPDDRVDVVEQRAVPVPDDVRAFCFPMPETYPPPLTIKTAAGQIAAGRPQARRPEARPAALSPPSPTRFGISCVANHSSSWSSAPSTVNCASSSPASAAPSAAAAAATSASASSASTCTAAALASGTAPATRTSPSAAGSSARSGSAAAVAVGHVHGDHHPAARRPGSAGQQPQRGQRGPVQRRVLQLLDVVGDVPLAQRGRDRVGVERRRSPARPPCTPRRDRGGSGGRRRAWLAAFVVGSVVGGSARSRSAHASPGRPSGYVRASPFESPPTPRGRPSAPANHPVTPSPPRPLPRPDHPDR